MPDRTLETIREVTGYQPDTCPWQAYSDPVVIAVLQAYRACSNDSGCTPALLLPTDPQAIVWNGLLHYKASLDMIRDNFRRLDDEERKRKSHG